MLSKASQWRVSFWVLFMNWSERKFLDEKSDECIKNELKSDYRRSCSQDKLNYITERKDEEPFENFWIIFHRFRRLCEL